MGNMWNKLWWGGNPDKQNAVTGLSRRDLYHISTSWAVVYEQPLRYGMDIFIRFFRVDRNTQNYFKPIQNMKEDEIIKSSYFKAHVINVMSALNVVVTNIDNPEVVIAFLNKYRDSHHEKGVKRVFFDEFKAVMLDVLRDELSVSNAVLASWGRFIDFMYKHLIVDTFDMNA